ncbi:zf-TFIIB domain-containing protein [Sphingomonas limnosediminicola]|uniref:Zf-TFIIB domain-containing protein n=1 Tax=Sphingomonas limnosediminicola TaxID=940133 RepID=A0ABP7LKH7_9SPHN
MRERNDGMICPIDGAGLVMSERQGIEIDYCPSCRGVWLDRGELDKIVNRSSRETGPERPSAPWPDRSFDRNDFRQKRRKSFLEELFD